MANLIQLSLQFPEEIWKDIEGWEGYYQISSFARVKSLERVVAQNHTTRVQVKEKILSQYVAAQTGYLVTSLRRTAKLNKKVAIHVLVAKAFVEGYFDGYQVNHEDGNKLNNLPYNLKWGTCLYNVQHAVRTGLMDIKGSKHPNAKVNEDQVLEMRQLYKDGLTHTQIAKMFELSRRNTSDIVSGRLWKHI